MGHHHPIQHIVLSVMHLHMRLSHRVVMVFGFIVLIQLHTIVLVYFDQLSTGFG
jgi:hypothetical protein